MKFPSLLHPARKTQERDDATRELIIEAVREALTPATRQTDVAPSRRTFPMSDAASELAVKQYGNDVANRARKITLYQTFLGEAWISACVEAIAGRLVSGGWTLKPVDPKHPNESSREPILECLNWTNALESFTQLIHESATDLLWAGECYLEVTWKYHPGLGREVPYEIYSVDVISMDYVLNDSKKFIKGYTQVSDTGAKIDLEPRDIIRIWLPDPRNKLRALSPIEKLLNPTTWDTYLQLGEQKYFEQGNRSDIHINLKNGDENLAKRYVKWFRETFLGVKNAHMPLITYGDTEVKNVGDRSTLDVLARRKFARDEILAVYKVLPEAVSLVEHGGIGQGAASDSHDKMFVHGAVDPVKQRIFEALNFALTVRGFGIDDWVIDVSYADMRDTKETVEIMARKIERGMMTPNQANAELKQDPVEGGDEAVFVLSREVIPLRELPKMQSNQTEDWLKALANNKVATRSIDGLPTNPDSQMSSESFDDEDDDDEVTEGRLGVHHPRRGKRQREANRKPVFTEAQQKELAFWEKVTLRRLREGKDIRAWRSEILPAELVADINADLLAVETVEEAQAVFAAAKRDGVPQWLKDHVDKVKVEIDTWNADLAERLIQELRNASVA